MCNYRFRFTLYFYFYVVCRKVTNKTWKAPVGFGVSRFLSTAFDKMNPPKILMTNPSIPRIAFDLLGEKCELICTKDDKRESILEKVSGVDAIFWATKENLDQEVLDKAGPQMKTVGAMSAGINNIDVPELKKRGIKLGNTPGVLDDAVADVAILLTLGAARRLHEGRLKIEQNEWTPGFGWMLGQDIACSTVGIVGLGGIGQAIVKRLKCFSVDKFLYTGHREKPEGKELGCNFVSLDTLVKESDFVIVACPLTTETRGMFNEEMFSKMKKNAVFVNVSRGEVVKQDALIQALKTNTIFAAGLDVMTPEPLPSDHELLKLPNVVVMPHLGSATTNTRNAMAELTAQNILRGLGGAEMFTPVGFGVSRFLSTVFDKMNPPKVLMTNPSIPRIAFDLLGEKCELICTKDGKRESILEKVSGVDAIFWATKENLDQEILDKAGPQMKTVGTISVGINNIDVPELEKRGIKLGNTATVSDDAVADVAILLTLGAARRLHEGRLKIEQNEWTPGFSWMLGQDITCSTVGIVGLGGIGRAIVKRLKCFSVNKFLYTGHWEKPEGKELGCNFVSLDTLVRESDFVIVACPLTTETRGMFNEEMFSKMKKNAVFVNVSRGEVVKQDALIQALKTNTIFAAGLDVMTPEPLPPDHELLKLPNVVVMPHLGSATTNTRNAMAELTAQNILRGLGGAEMFTPVC